MSLDPRLRRALELALRIAAFALLAWAFWTALHRRDRGRGAVIHVSELPARLTTLTRDAGLASLHADVDSAPSAASLAWLRALRHAGATVGWSGEVPALAASLEPLADPMGGTRLAVAAPPGRVAVRDDAGSIDTLSLRAGGASLALPFVSGEARVVSGAFVARPPRADSLALRRVLVVGAAGWDAKFAAAALEERGWRVSTEFLVAPGATVVQDAAPLDTGRFSAVVALDTSVRAIAPSLVRFVHEGGGLVLAGDAARTAALAALAPGSLGERVAARAILVADSVGPSTLGGYPIVALKPDAVPVRRAGTKTTVAAMRVGAGRVVQTGIDESWRWRMEGAANGVAAHRAWWSSLVGAVAYAPVVKRRAGGDPLDAPRARLADALGAPSPVPATPRTDTAPSPWVLTVALLLLLIEWGSRRLRGAP